METKQTSLFNMVVGSVALIAVIIIGISLYYVVRQKTPTPSPVTPSGQTSTTTPATTGANTGASTSTPVSNLKKYSSAAFGFSFNYPKDFFLKSETFNPDGKWVATFRSDRGDINITVAKGAITSNDIKLQTTTTKIGPKDAMLFVTRRDVCDVKIARSSLDSDYSIEFAFAGCSQQLGSIFNDTEDVAKILSSVTFNNENTRVYTDPKLGILFRYPVTWTRPTQYPSESGTGTYTSFGNNLQMIAGAEYSKTLKRNMTIAEIVASRVGTTTVDQLAVVGGKQSHILTITPVSGTKERVTYIPNTSQTDFISLSQRAVDDVGYTLVLGSFTFTKAK